MTSDPSPQCDELDPERWTIFQESESGLRAMLFQRLGDAAEVEDCLQFVFVKWIEQGGEVAVASGRAWLFRVAANRAALTWRQKQAAQRVHRKIAETRRGEVASESCDPIIRQESYDRLRRALAALPPEQSQALRLRFEDDLSFAEIAERLGVPLGTALTRVRRGLMKLRRDTDLRRDFQFDDDEPGPGPSKPDG